MNADAWRVTLVAALLMAIASGLRSAQGLFVSVLNGSTGLGLASLSLVFAVGQLTQGFSQPALGALADRVGAARVIVVSALAFALATAVIALESAPIAVALALIAASVAAGTLGASPLLLGEVNRRVDAARAGFAAGLVSAGVPLGQLVLGPGTQQVIERCGWRGALLATAVVGLCALPLARMLRRPGAQTAAPTERPPSQPIADVLRDRRFWLVAGSFCACGFHVAFLAVHMPGVIERCGLSASVAGIWIAVAAAANIAGSLAIGHALRSHDGARLLVAIYLLRALGIVGLLLLTPSVEVMLGFALVMGASHMATLPPTAQLVARQHGVQRLASLLGIVMLVHQLGSFAGIWFGGWAAQATGNDRLLWLVDIGLALGAATLVWPLRARRDRHTATRIGAAVQPQG